MYLSCFLSLSLPLPRSLSPSPSRSLSLSPSPNQLASHIAAQHCTALGCLFVFPTWLRFSIPVSISLDRGGHLGKRRMAKISR